MSSDSFSVFAYHTKYIVYVKSIIVQISSFIYIIVIP